MVRRKGRLRHVHTEKFRRCVKEVSKKSPGYNPYAVCEASIGYKGSMLPAHRRK